MSELRRQMSNIISDHSDWQYQCSCGGWQMGDGYPYSRHLAEMLIRGLHIRAVGGVPHPITAFVGTYIARDRDAIRKLTQWGIENQSDD